MIQQQTDDRYEQLADDETQQKVVAALERNGIRALRAADAEEARRLVLELISAGAEVHHGASQTLQETGIADALQNSGRFNPLRPQLFSLDRATQADQIRRLGAAPQVMLGSVNAVTETGTLLAASMSGSQLGPYVSGAGQVILIVGAQKVVRDLEEGLARIYDYAFPLEDARAQEAYGIHSAVNKIVIINGEFQPGRITVVLVDEALGF